MTTTPSKVHPEHLNRLAIVYIRQSSLAQVRFHRESTERQYALQEKALSLGWAPEQIQVIDEDLGISGSGRSQRLGFQNLVAWSNLWPGDFSLSTFFSGPAATPRAMRPVQHNRSG